MTMSDREINAPMPWQTRVGDLRRSLAGVPDDVVVALALPRGGSECQGLTPVQNVYVERYTGGPILRLRVGPKPESVAEQEAD